MSSYPTDLFYLKSIIYNIVRLHLNCLAVLTAASVVLVAGCGSEDEGGRTYSVDASTTVTTGSLSKAQFVARSNQICRETWQRIDGRIAGFQEKREKKAGPKTIFAQAVHSYVFPGIQVAIFDDLHLMGAPEGEETEIEEMIGALQFGIERGQERRIASVHTLEERFADFNLIAARYGIVDCLVIGRQLPAIRDLDDRG